MINQIYDGKVVREVCDASQNSKLDDQRGEKW